MDKYGRLANFRLRHVPTADTANLRRRRGVSVRGEQAALGDEVRRGADNSLAVGVVWAAQIRY